MADIHAFDISASLDMMEVKNAIETTKKEIGTRFDFKGIKAEIELNEKDKIITLLSSSESKIDAIKDVLLSKFIKRGIEIKALKEKTRESAGGGNFRLVLSLNDTIDQPSAKAIVKAIKDSKIKVNASIRGDEVRCQSKSIDELRLAMDIVKKMDLDLPIGFKNLK